MKTYDLVVLGSGFAGSLVARIGRALGLTVLLVERDEHPRFAIGESSSPLANLVLEEIVERWGLDDLRPFVNWGRWQANRPEIGCGLKRGFTFYGHRAGERWVPRDDRANELLVAASPKDEVADTHWLRSDFDRHLAASAVEAGADLEERTVVVAIRASSAGRELDLEGRTSVSVRAGLVVDATGPRGALHRLLGLAEERIVGMPETEALYSHFTGVEPFARGDGPTPYPAEAAAVHHMLPGGWLWLLRFADDVASVGVVLRKSEARRLELSADRESWDSFLSEWPQLAETIAGAPNVHPFVHADGVSFRVKTTHGDDWCQLPSAAGFVDPLLSTGFPLTLFGVERLGRLLETSSRPGREDLRQLAEAERADFDRAALLIAALWNALDDFELFARLTLLYFAAASWSETMRRLGRRVETEPFLAGGHPTFGRDLVWICRGVIEGTVDRSRTLDDVLAAIAPIDVAGLGDLDRRNHYPVLPSDLFAAADRIGVSSDEIDAMLVRVGLA